MWFKAFVAALFLFAAVWTAPTPGLDTCNHVELSDGTFVPPNQCIASSSNGQVTSMIYSCESTETITEPVYNTNDCSGTTQSYQDITNDVNGFLCGSNDCAVVWRKYTATSCKSAD
eukprot:386180_1